LAAIFAGFCRCDPAEFFPAIEPIRPATLYLTKGETNAEENP
jgi:hypothetical protein